MFLIFNYFKKIIINNKMSKHQRDAENIYVNITINNQSNQSVDAVFTASFAVNVMTVTAMTSGRIITGQTITGTGIPAGTIITSLGTGTGGTGTYFISTNLALAPMTVNASISKIVRKVAQYSAEYENPLLDDPSDYYLSVVKFQIPLDELPLFICPVVPGQTLTYGSGVPIQTPFQVGVYEVEPAASIVPPLPAPPTPLHFVQNVTWIPAWWNYPAPLSAGGTVNLDDLKFSDLLYVYSYQIICERVNAALLAAWTAAGSPGGQQPYYVFENERFSLIMPYSFVSAATTNPAAQGWSVFVDVNLLEVFPGFRYNLSSDQQRYEIPIDYLSYSKNYWATEPYGTITLGPPAVPDTYKLDQEYTSFEYLSSARKIVMTSNTIPARKEYYPVPTNFNPNANSTGVNNGLGIISDFQLDLTNRPGEQRSIATYNADLYRMVDLVSTHPMRKIDVNLFWSDAFNNLFPLYISPYGTINIKLGFFHKNRVQMVREVQDKGHDVVGQGYKYKR